MATQLSSQTASKPMLMILSSLSQQIRKPLMGLALWSSFAFFLESLQLTLSPYDAATVVAVVAKQPMSLLKRKMYFLKSSTPECFTWELFGKGVNSNPPQSCDFFSFEHRKKKKKKVYLYVWRIGCILQQDLYKLSTAFSGFIFLFQNTLVIQLSETKLCCITASKSIFLFLPQFEYKY